MTIIYTRPKEEKTYECEDCGTFWRDSWIDAEDNTHRGWCPYCDAPNIPTQMVKLNEFRRVPFNPDLKQYLKDLAYAEQVGQNCEKLL